MTAQNVEATTVTLREVLTGDQAGYQLKMGYGLQLKHGLMGYFPAIFNGDDDVVFGGTARFVLVTDKELLRKVLQYLPRRDFEIDQSLCYVDPLGSSAFPLTVGGRSINDILGWSAKSVLTELEFEQLITVSKEPFRWAPGLFGGEDLSVSRFEYEVDKAIIKLA